MSNDGTTLMCLLCTTPVPPNRGNMHDGTGQYTLCVMTMSVEHRNAWVSFCNGVPLHE